jgi:hypothetical protein
MESTIKGRDKVGSKETISSGKKVSPVFLPEPSNKSLLGIASTSSYFLAPSEPHDQISVRSETILMFGNVAFNERTG